MLQLQAKNIDISRISKLLVKYNVKASISDSTITLDGNISESLLTELCMEIEIHSVQNYISEEQMNISEENSLYKSEATVEIPNQISFSDSNGNDQSEIVEEPINNVMEEEHEEIQTLPSTNALSHNTPEYDLIYSVVKRGEVYMCDFGKPYGKEQGFERYAIIIQNDIGNAKSPTTIVIACTTETKKEMPVHYKCTFSEENMIDYDEARVGSKENTILAEQIRTVDKRRLRKYLGILRPEFMEAIQKKIDFSLALKRKVKRVINEEKIIIDTPISIADEKMVLEEKQPERKDVNMVQVQILSLVDIGELLKISQESSTDEIKTKKMLELFGFDLDKNGVQYLLKAIVASTEKSYFNLEMLSQNVSKEESVDNEEVKRLIVARVKETLGFKKAPTIDFIRLINIFLA